MRNLSAFIIIATLAAGCTGNRPGDTSDTSDTNEPTEFGTIDARPTFLGNPQDCVANAIGPESYTWNTGESTTHEVAVGQYVVEFGTGNYGGVPGHQLEDGTVIVAPGVDATVAKDATVAATAAMNVFAEGTTWMCVTNSCQIDDSGDTLEKTNCANTPEQGPWNISVQNGHKIVNQDDAKFHGALSETGWFEVVGNTIVTHDDEAFYPGETLTSSFVANSSEQRFTVDILRRHEGDPLSINELICTK